MPFAVEKAPRIRLSCKLVPVRQYLEYEYDLFIASCSFEHGFENFFYLICWKISSAVKGDHVISGTLGEKHSMA